MSAFTAPIRLQPGFSRTFAVAVILGHGGALLLVPALVMPGWVKGVLAILVVVGGIRAFLWHLLHRGDAITEVFTDSWGRWVVTTHGRGASPAALATDSVVQPWLTVLVFKLGDGRRRSVLLLPDCVEPPAFRRVRVRLRYPLATDEPKHGV